MTTFVSSVPAGRGSKVVLHDAAEAPVVSNIGIIGEADHSVQSSLVGTGALTATINIDYSNDLIGWLPGPQIVLSGTTLVTDAFHSAEKWIYCKATLVSITGTGAKLTTTVAV